MPNPAATPAALYADPNPTVAHWSELRDQLQGLANTIREIDPKSAAHSDLADYIETAISDADGMCALALYERGDREDVAKALDIWAARVKAKAPVTLATLIAAPGAMAGVVS